MEKIKLVFPSNPKYLQALRLTTASIFNSEGFDVENIEDAKVIVSELFTMLLAEEDKIKTKFEICDESINVIFKRSKITTDSNISGIDFELKQQILKALADDIIIDNERIKVVINK